jgi:hypothetical protein
MKNVPPRPDLTRVLTPLEYIIHAPTNDRQYCYYTRPSREGEPGEWIAGRIGANWSHELIPFPVLECTPTDNDAKELWYDYIFNQ